MVEDDIGLPGVLRHHHHNSSASTVSNVTDDTTVVNVDCRIFCSRNLAVNILPSLGTKNGKPEAKSTTTTTTTTNDITFCV